MNMLFYTHTDICKELGARIKKQRVLRMMKQEDLAASAGVSRKTLTTLENTGKSTLENFIKVVYALGLESEFEKLLVPAIVDISQLETKEDTRKRVRG